MQGIILNDVSNLKKFKFKKQLTYHLKKFNKWCMIKKISKLEACILFVKNIKDVKYITIGFNSAIELEEILRAFGKNKKLNFNLFRTSNKKIIDPRKW